jgi:hypothetical protein
MAKLLVVLCAALFSCLAIAPASARAATPGQPTPPQFTVRLVAARGSGCPVGSTAVSALSDTGFAVDYGQYTASAGGGPTPGLLTSCQLNVLVGVPSGWTYGIASEQYRGFANLDTGAQANLQTNYYFGSILGTPTQGRSLSGPMSDAFEFDHQDPIATFAPCHYNGTLNIDSALRVFPGTNPSFFNEITLDAIDLGFSSVFWLAFQQC